MAQLNEFDHPDFVPERKTSSIINHALAMYKGIALYGIIAMLIYITGSYIIQNAIGFDSVKMLDEIRSNEGYYSEFNYGEIPGFSTFLTLSGIFVLLLSPLYTGLIFIAAKYNYRIKARFSDLFIGYHKNFIQIIIYSIIAGLLSGFAALFCFFPLLLVYPFLLSGYAVLLFEDASAIEALKRSAALARQNYGTFLAVTIVGMLMSWSGVVLCGIGIVLTAPFFAVVTYSAYRAFSDKPVKIL
ncbi:beta-carotene 15,15'-monooxygenase [uncultured Chryseobacterium sp.]|uniref:beta-carotene 15,15'-monooxygenase n=1 Tax=uncultured Chryseobacterium sp. TaxID=259322 RepID=UPI0025F0F41C|nr:beta-carotene 15,15'-monooxygenase [uncultured Chryseobacterium sp.]